MRRIGIATLSRAKHLGIHFGPGPKTKEGKAGAVRWVANAARRFRVNKLGRRLGSHIFSTGLKLAVLFGG